MPLPHIYTPLFDLFFTHMSQHFPSVSRQRMNERFESGTMSQFQANCICALGARFSQEAQDNPTLACAPFIAKAQELIVPLLHLPTSDVVTGLLLLAWACFGQNSESGQWQYSGMAIRMAIDLGHHEVSDIYESPAHLVRTRLLFWSLFITDRIVAFAIGRPASLPEDIIEIPLPEDQDFFPDPARNTLADPMELVEPVPFVQLVKLMIICGRISNVLNGRRGRARTLVSTKEPLAEQLGELQVRLVRFISGLPPSLQWSVDNFKRQHARGHAVGHTPFLGPGEPAEKRKGRLPEPAPLGECRPRAHLPPRAAEKPLRHRDAAQPKHESEYQACARVIPPDQRVHGVCRPRR